MDGQQSKLLLEFNTRKVQLIVPSNTSLDQLRDKVAEKLEISGKPFNLEFYSKDFDAWIEVDANYQLPEIGKLKIILLECQAIAADKPKPFEASGKLPVTEGTVAPQAAAKGNNGEQAQTGNSADHDEAFPMCSNPPEKSSSEQGSSQKQSTAARAHVNKDKIWKKTETLKVYFMEGDIDPKTGKYDKEYSCIEGWTCGHTMQPLTIQNIVDWASIWEDSSCPDIPSFEQTGKIDRAHLRVKFSDIEGENWSYVGTDAKDPKIVKPREPTMTLSLRGYGTALQKSLVIHEFGHALGLEHEHQRSDFWKVLGKYLDQEKMKKDLFKSCYKAVKDQRAAFGRDWEEKEETEEAVKSEYDPKSIMHYKFNTAWIQKASHRECDGVDQDTDLNSKEKEYLKGLVKRSKSGELPSKPSLKDRRALQKAYGGAESIQEQPGTSVPATRTVQSLSTDDLVVWLKQQGVSNKDCDILAEENITGQSLMLLNKEVYKSIGIKSAGQLLLDKIIQKLNDNPKLVAELDTVQEEQPTKEELDQEQKEGTASKEEVKKTGTTIISNQLISSSASIDKPIEKVDVLSGSHRVQTEINPAGAAGAMVATEKIWRGRERLFVYFMDSVDSDVRKGKLPVKEDYMCIQNWTCRGHPMSVNTILAWARVWNLPVFPELPYFEITERISKADIRVRFSDTSGNWSMVGMEARHVYKTKPTMMLSLKGLSAELMESLVIHQFGHALGLEHEHQRSDFWDVMEKYLDIEKMKRDPVVNPYGAEDRGAGFRRDWYKRFEQSATGAAHRGASAYDPTSIMHYWFDIKWLKNTTLQTYANIDKEITVEPDRTYLKGLHKIFKSSSMGGLPKKPSMNDYRRLVEAYGGRFMFSPQLDALKTGSAAIRQDSIVEGLLSVDEHLYGILGLVQDCASKWGPLGLELRLSFNALADIENKQSVREKLEAVIKAWMSSGKATIYELLNALESPPVDREDIADEIRAKVGIYA